MGLSGAFKRLFVNNKAIEDLVGDKCVVTERIDSFAGCGQVRVNGKLFAARGISDNDVFEVGDVLSIVAIEGVKMICRAV